MTDPLPTLRALLAAAGPGEVQANLRLITALHLAGPALVEVAERAGDLYGLSPADITYTRLDRLDAATVALRAVDLSAVGRMGSGARPGKGSGA